VKRNFKFWQFFIRSPISGFVILKLYLILDGLILLRKSDFCCEVCLCDGFWRRHFRRRVQDMGQSLLKQYDRTVLYTPVHHGNTIHYYIHYIV